MRRRGMTSRPSSRAAVSLRPWVSTTPTTRSSPCWRLARAVESISKVLPTPGAAPRKIFSRPRDSFAACCSKASGEGRVSRFARSSLTGTSRQVERRTRGYRDPDADAPGTDADVPALWLAARERVQSQIQLKDVDMWLAEEAQKPALDVVGNELANLVFRQIARLGHPRDLEIGAGRGDVRVEAAGRTRHQIDRYRLAVVGLQLGDIACHPVDQRLRGGAKIRGIGIRRVIGRRNGLARTVGSVDGGQPAMEIFVADEVLADQLRTNDLAVLVVEQATVRLMRKDDLCDLGHSQGIGDAQQQSEGDDHHDGGEYLFQHGSLP